MSGSSLNRFLSNNSSNGFIWNAVGGSLFAGQSVIVLFLCARFYDQDTAGIISISYAIAMLIQTIALYGVRNYQVTDSKENHRFDDYFILRVISIIFAIFFLLTYVFLMYKINNYTVHKCVIVIEMSLLKLINAFEDVLMGRLQQKGSFVIGARVGTIREFFTLIVISLLMCLRFDIAIVLLCGIIFGIVAETALIWIVWPFLKIDISKNRLIGGNNVYDLAKSCFPLCISTVLAIYLSNIPKYVTDWYLDELSQAIVGYLILPVFTIALLNQFIYTPFIKDLGDLWNDGNLNQYILRIVFQTVLIALSTIFILLISYFIGIPILTKIYNIELRPYSYEFVLLLIGGGLYALEYYLIIPVTVMHEQSKIAVCYIFAIAVSFIIQKKLVTHYKLIGVSSVYILINLLITIFLVFIIFKKIIYQKRLNEM